MTVAVADSRRGLFFEYLFRGGEGFIFTAYRDPVSKKFLEESFRLPEQEAVFLNSISPHVSHQDVYFCPQLFESGKSRTKDNVKMCTCAWADLDTCHPDNLLLEPTFSIESSPGRFQAYWAFEEPMDPHDAEDISKRIAYYHAKDGADKSGWDLTQLLRIPLTLNHKYRFTGAVPQVKFHKNKTMRYNITDFDVYPPTGEHSVLEYPFPETFDVIEAEPIFEKYRMRLQPAVQVLFDREPQDDWSKDLWQLQMMCFESGMSKEEVYVIADLAACNKFKRDNRPKTSLWKDVVKAWIKFEEQQMGWTSSAKVEALLTDEERKQADSQITIVEEYIEWAKTVGDASWQYHQAGAFVTLSTLLAGHVVLPTSFGRIVPNLWFMILADTTLTRKTTAMDIAMDMVGEIDSDAIMATDGSIEGLFTSLSTRPGRPSVFLRDEFSGLLESMVKKDYMAGMMETLTKLYDGKYQKRILKKDVIEVRDPVFILFAGGIKTRIQAQLNYEHVGSGFLPRFLFISAEADTTKLRPLGPPTDQSLGKRAYIVSKLSALHSHYTQTQTVTINGRTVESPRRFEADLTPEAWRRYNKFELDMVELGQASSMRDVMVPTFDRMSKSALKMSILIAATRFQEGKVKVEEADVVKAFSYIERWRPYTLEVLANLGKTASERNIDLVYNAIGRQPGVLKSHIMRSYHLSAKEMDAILQTLDQRQMISRVRSGRTEKLFQIGGNN